MSKTAVLDRNDIMETLKTYTGVDFDAKKYNFHDDQGRIMYGNYSLGSEDALDLAAKWAGIPNKFLGKCSTDLQVQLLNEFYTRSGEKNKYPQIVSRHGMIETFVNEDAVYLPPEHVLDLIEESIEFEGYDRLFHKDGLVHLYAVTAEQHAVEVGDVCKGGTFVEFSPYGDVAPFVAGYVFRLKCSNGAISTDQLVKYQHRGGMDIDTWFRRVLPNASRAVEGEVVKYQKMKETPLNGNAVDLAKHFMPKGLSSLIREEIMEEIARRHPENLYELMNILTWYGSHRATDQMQAYRLMYTGGAISADHDFCPTCHTLMD